MSLQIITNITRNSRQDTNLVMAEINATYWGNNREVIGSIDSSEWNELGH